MRLIDADALEKDANEDLLSYTDTADEFYWNDGAKSIIDLIKTAPTIDPVRQGCWMTKDYEYGTDGEEDRWVERIALEGDYAYCSQCGGEILLDGGEDYVYSAYCPHCGTKMKEVTNDDER